MAEIIPPTHEDHPVTHETSDVNVADIGKIVGLLIAGAVLIHFFVVWVFDVLEVRTQRAQPKLSPLVQQARADQPREADARLVRVGGGAVPALQTDDIGDMNALRAQEDAQLNSYGWVNREEKVVHIPIARALELLANPETARARGFGPAAPSKVGKGAKSPGQEGK